MNNEIKVDFHGLFISKTVEQVYFSSFEQLAFVLVNVMPVKKGNDTWERAKLLAYLENGGPKLHRLLIESRADNRLLSLSLIHVMHWLLNNESMHSLVSDEVRDQLCQFLFSGRAPSSSIKASLRRAYGRQKGRASDKHKIQAIAAGRRFFEDNLHARFSDFFESEDYKKAVENITYSRKTVQRWLKTNEVTWDAKPGPRPR